MLAPIPAVCYWPASRRRALSSSSSSMGKVPARSGMRPLRISVLMPVHNAPSRLLDEAVRSVLRQSYPGWELCICDDGSTLDDTVQLLQTYRGADPRIKIIHSPGDLGAARAT